MKKAILIITALALMLSLFAGCNARSGAAFDTAPSTSESTEQAESSEHDSQAIETSPTEEKNLAALFTHIRAVVLSQAVVPLEDGAVNDYFTPENGYEVATILTLGLSFPEKESAYRFGGLVLTGETATDDNGKPVPQSTYRSSWINTEREKPYAIVILRIAGRIDPSKVSVQIKDRWGEVSSEIRVENSGHPIGFADAEKAFPDQVCRLQGREYIVVRRYLSNLSTSGTALTDTISYVLVPLEGGFEKTLDSDGMKLITPDNVPSTSGKLLVNVHSAIDATTIAQQSTIELAVTRDVRDDRDENGHLPDEAIKQADEDMRRFAAASYVVIENGNGGSVTLPFG